MIYLAYSNLFGEYYRGRLDKIDYGKGTVGVFFIDYGNSEEDISIEHLIQISKKAVKDLNLTDLISPAQAIEATLAHIKPNPIRTGDQWDKEAIECFENLLEMSKIDDNWTCKGDIYAITTFDHSGEIFLRLKLYHHARTSPSHQKVNLIYFIFSIFTYRIVGNIGRPFL